MFAVRTLKIHSSSLNLTSSTTGKSHKIISTYPPIYRMNYPVSQGCRSSSAPHLSLPTLMVYLGPFCLNLDILSPLPIVLRYLNLRWAQSAISKRPSNPDPNDLLVMWIDLQETDLDYTEVGLMRKQGVVKARILNELHPEIAALQAVVSNVYSSLSDDCKRFIKENVETLHPLPLTNAIVKVDNTRMGVFVFNNTDAQLLFQAGFLVYYVHPYVSFNWQIIQKIVPFECPVPPLIQTSPAIPSYNPIVTTQASLDNKHAAICIATINCFDQPDPFTNIYIPSSYSSLYQLGTSRISVLAYLLSSTNVSIVTGSNPSSHTCLHRTQSFPTQHKRQGVLRPKKLSINSSKSQWDLFIDLPTNNSFVPPAILTWSDINQVLKHITTTVQKCLLVAPDPALFFGLEDNGQQLSMLAMWNHL
ncbi:hypothetical protein GYMLUDRAFT_59412 [Collybiopsis luxurians FD-317 M1]|uniref:Uncharacterized protein n=1 Tax=Collybiopsis luxurians FD-317 M1 TaxID=944289 RepID=A0A0D0CDZ3_9AGAR|nr:hypothetical protein GYMLUDRAFT_59412 [Collybiopsis luxurians FD-317 M1]